MNHISLQKINSYLILACVNTLVGLFSLIYLLYNYNYNTINTIFNNNIFYIILISSIIFFFNPFFIIYLLKLTPNISYTHSIVNLNIIFTIIGSYYIFNQKLNFNSIIGMLISLIGILIMINYSND